MVSACRAGIAGVGEPVGGAAGLDDLPGECQPVKGAFAESSFASGNLPPILLPQMSFDLPYEPDRAFAHFTQLTAPEARAVEYLQHTGNTNPAAAVAELGVNPDLGVELTTVTTPFVNHRPCTGSTAPQWISLHANDARVQRITGADQRFAAGSQ
jgi:hypothetical protein